MSKLHAAYLVEITRYLRRYGRLQVNTIDDEKHINNFVAMLLTVSLHFNGFHNNSSMLSSASIQLVIVIAQLSPNRAKTELR